MLSNLFTLNIIYLSNDYFLRTVKNKVANFKFWRDKLRKTVLRLVNLAGIDKKSLNMTFC